MANTYLTGQSCQLFGGVRFLPFFFLYQKMLTFSDKKGEEIVYIYNLRQNICGLFYFLSQLVFITSETKLDYYHQKVNVRVAWRVAERLKDLSQLGNFKKIPEMLGFDGEYPAAPQKAKFGWFLVKNCKKSAVKHSIEKPSLLNFVSLSPTLCPRLPEETAFHFWLVPDTLVLYFLKILVFEKAHSLFKYLSKNTILHFSVNYEFGTKRCSSFSRAVFMKRFYLYLLNTDHFGGYNAFLNK